MKLSFVALLVCALPLSGCALLKSPEAKTVVDLAFAKCVSEAESTDATIVAKLCGVGPELYAILTELLAAKKAGMSKAGVCKPAPTASVTPRVPACVYVTGYREAYLDVDAVSQ